AMAPAASNDVQSVLLAIRALGREPVIAQFLQARPSPLPGRRCDRVAGVRASRPMNCGACARRVSISFAGYRPGPSEPREGQKTDAATPECEYARWLVIVLVVEAETAAAGLAEIALHGNPRADLDLDDDLAGLRRQPLGCADIDPSSKPTLP